MLELVDRMVSKTIVRKGVRVRVPLSVIFKSLSFKKGFFVCGLFLFSAYFHIHLLSVRFAFHH